MNENNVTPLNKQLLYLVIAILLVLSGFLIKFYYDQRKINNALKIKVLTMSKTRKTPTPWQRLMNAPNKPQILSSKKAENIITTSTITPPLDNLDIQELALLLNARMKNVKSQDLIGLEKNIEIANQIISKDPDSYSAYKAKLVSLLIEEGKLKVQVDDNEINNLLETMAQFDLTSDKVAKKEASLISNASNEVERKINELNEITLRRNQLESELEILPPESAERQAVAIERINLLAQEEETAKKISTLEESLATNNFPEDQYLNEDVVQIPFLRLMAKKDYDGVIDNATSFIEQFPNSVDGYYFLIKGLEASGRQDEVINVIQDSRLSPNAQTLLQEKLKKSDEMDFSKYWENLNF